jgi:hypothetical protein
MAIINSIDRVSIDQVGNHFSVGRGETLEGYPSGTPSQLSKRRDQECCALPIYMGAFPFIIMMGKVNSIINGFLLITIYTYIYPHFLYQLSPLSL